MCSWSQWNTCICCTTSHWSCGWQCPIIPDTTHPKYVFTSIGEPRWPCRWPWYTTWLNMSTPKRISLQPGSPNSGSARQRRDRCLNLIANGTDSSGKMVAILGKTTTSTFLQGPKSLPTSTALRFVTVNVDTKHNGRMCSVLNASVLNTLALMR